MRTGSLGFGLSPARFALPSVIYYSDWPDLTVGLGLNEVIVTDSQLF